MHFRLPRGIQVPLMSKVSRKLKRKEEMGVISCVDGHTDWCAGMVVVPKQVRVCVDLTKLNENVLRENHPLPCVDHTLAQLSVTTIFSKFDANSGF